MAIFSTIRKVFGLSLGFLISIPYFIITVFRRILGFEWGGLYILPHGLGRSIHFRFPTRLFKLFFLIFILVFTIAGFLSLGNLILGYSHYLTLKENREKKETVVTYQALIKDYLVQHDQKEKQVAETIAMLFNPKTDKSDKSLENVELNGVGGSDNNFNPNDLLYDYSYYQFAPESWDDYFANFSDQEYITFVDRHIENLEGIYSMVDKFEIHLNQQKKIAKSIPSSWPVRKLHQVNQLKNDLSEESKQEIQTSLKENSEGVSVEEGTLAIDSILSLVNDKSSSSQSLAIDIHQPMAVISTSRGIVNTVVKQNGLWGVIVKHEYGFSTYYRGLDTVSVKPGDLVNRSAMLGTIGNAITPKSTPKLKYQIKVATQFINPRDFLIFNY